MTLVEQGDFDEAVRSLERAAELAHGAPQYLAGLAYGLASAGREREAEEILGRLDALSRFRFVSSFDRAIIRAGMKDVAGTMDWLEKAFKERDFWCFIIKVAPQLDLVRGEPAFIRLLESSRL